MFCTSLLTTTVLFTSCNNDKTYDFDGISYQRIYIQSPNTTKSGTVLKTPLGYISSFKGEVAVKTTSATNETTNVVLTVDNSLVDSYNSVNKTEYKAMPDGVVSLAKTNITIEAGKMMSDSISLVVSEDGYSKLTAGTSYLIPVTIKGINGSDAHLAQDKKYLSNYFVLKYEETKSMIRSGGSASDLIGSTSKDADGKSWKCISAQNLDPDKFANLFSENQKDRKWDFLNGKEVLTASFTVDLGTSHKIGGFSINCYLAKYMDIQLSSDNNQWTEIGDTKNAESILDLYWDPWYAFYGTLSARYVKITITLDPDSWAWQYADWGYCTISSFKLLLDD